MTRRIIVAWTVLLGPIAAAPAETPQLVGRHGDLRRVVIEGADRVRPSQIREALNTRLALIPATRATASLPELIETLPALVRDGYRNSGFPQTEVTGRFDAGRDAIVLTIVEGPQCLCDEVLVEGVDEAIAVLIRKAVVEKSPSEKEVPRMQVAADGQRIVEWVNEDGKPQSLSGPVWKVGKPWNDSKSVLTDAASHAQRALQNKGYWGAELEARFLTSPDKLRTNLVIGVTQLGRPVVLEEVKITGAERNTVEEILACAGLKTGAPWNLATQIEAESKLYDSGRFVWHRFSVNRASIRGGRCWLRLHLEESRSAPLLREALTDQDRLVMAALQRVSEMARGETDVVFRFRGPLWFVTMFVDQRVVDLPDTECALAEIPSGQPGGWNWLPFEFGGGASKAHGVLEWVTVGDGQGPFRAGYVVRDHAKRISLTSLHSRKHWAMSAETGGLLLRLDARGRKAGVPSQSEDDRQFRYEFGFRLRTESDDPDEVRIPIAFSVSPAFALDMNRRHKATVKVHGPVTRISTEDGVKVDIETATGRVVRIWAEDVELRTMVEIRSAAPGTLEELTRLVESTERLPNVYNADRPFESFVDFVLSEAALIPTLTNDERDVIGIVRKLTLNTCAQVREHIGSDPEPEDDSDEVTYSIPLDAGGNANGLLEMVGHVALTIDSALFARESTFSRFGRELLVGRLLQDIEGEQQLQKLMSSPQAGPLLCLYGVETVGRVMPDFRKELVLSGLHRLDVAHFRADLKQLLAREGLMAEILKTLVQTLNELEDSELDLLLRAMKFAEPAREECRELLHNRDRSPEDRFVEIAEVLWQAGGRAKIAGRFRYHLTGTREAGETGSEPEDAAKPSEANPFGIPSVVPTTQGSNPFGADEAAETLESIREGLRKLQSK